MTTLEGWGIFSIGAVFGYLLFYAVKHTKEFNIEMLTTAVGAVGGGVGLQLGQIEGWIGPYGVGLGVGFLCYIPATLLLTRKTGDGKMTDSQSIRCRNLLGSPGPDSR